MKILFTAMSSLLLLQAGCASDDMSVQCNDDKCDSLDPSDVLVSTVQIIDGKNGKCLTYVGAQPFAGRDFAWQDCRDEEMAIQSFTQESYGSGDRRFYQEHDDQMVHLNFGSATRALSFDTQSIDPRFVYWIYDSQTVFQEKFTERDPDLASPVRLLPATEGQALALIERNPTDPEERNDWSVTCLATEGFSFLDPDTDRDQIVTADISLSRGSAEDACFDYNGNGVPDCQTEQSFEDLCAKVEIRSLD